MITDILRLKLKKPVALVVGVVVTIVVLTVVEISAVFVEISWASNFRGDNAIINVANIRNNSNTNSNIYYIYNYIFKFEIFITLVNVIIAYQNLWYFIKTQKDWNI